jgi:ABC-2 type transport system ATP-binding protein
MPDFFGVYDNLKTAEYLAFFGELYGLGGAGLAGRIDEVLAMTRLEGKKDAFVETLSRGMKQRLCLAKSLVHRPELLILDEPASGLDPNARIEIRHILKDLRAAGTTVVVSSHVLSELEEVCTHVGFMEKGVLIRSGPLDEMKNAARRERHLSIRFREPARGLDSVMRLPGVLDARLAGETVRVRIADDDEVSEAVLAAAHASGARPVSIAETAPTLEDLFTTVTSGEVS